MSARGSCYDNAVVESFFASLKRERCKRMKYKTREDAKADIFDYIERFYNRKRSHSYLDISVQCNTKTSLWDLNQLVRNRGARPVSQVESPDPSPLESPRSGPGSMTRKVLVLIRGRNGQRTLESLRLTGSASGRPSERRKVSS